MTYVKSVFFPVFSSEQSNLTVVICCIMNCLIRITSILFILNNSSGPFFFFNKQSGTINQNWYYVNTSCRIIFLSEELSLSSSTARDKQPTIAIAGAPLTWNKLSVIRHHTHQHLKTLCFRIWNLLSEIEVNSLYVFK